MSYYISLVDPVTKDVLTLDENQQIEVGPYAIGGTRESSLNITYNYSAIFQKVLVRENKNIQITESDAKSILMGDFSYEDYEEQIGIRIIYGMSGAESISVLEKAISQLSGDTDPDYWKATEGNAKHALGYLLELAKLRPDGIWMGD